MKITDLARLEAQRAALEAKIEQLRADPNYAQESEALHQLQAAAREMGLTPEEGAQMLHPERFSAQSSKPMILNTIPRAQRSDRKLLLFDALREARVKIDAWISRLESDELCARKVRLEEAARAAGFSPYEAAELLSPLADPQGVSPDPVRKDKAEQDGRGVRPLREWRNPHTGEVVCGRSPTLRRLREWAQEHEVDLQTVRRDWQVPSETPNKAEP